MRVEYKYLRAGERMDVMENDVSYIVLDGLIEENMHHSERATIRRITSFQDGKSLDSVVINHVYDDEYTITTSFEDGSGNTKSSPIKFNRNIHNVMDIFCGSGKDYKKYVVRNAKKFLEGANAQFLKKHPFWKYAAVFDDTEVAEGWFKLFVKDYNRQEYSKTLSPEEKQRQVFNTFFTFFNNVVNAVDIIELAIWLWSPNSGEAYHLDFNYIAASDEYVFNLRYYDDIVLKYCYSSDILDWKKAGEPKEQYEIKGEAKEFYEFYGFEGPII